MKIPQPDLGQEFVAKAFGKAIPSVCDKGEFGKSCYSQEKNLTCIGQFFAQHQSFVPKQFLTPYTENKPILSPKG